ncbi:Calcium-dependent phospholipid-binding Copine family protein [Perilla frutescens var. hirtella]|uniref:Calcium-dependent phospholipid-binding Copine family protein n=1 Tax=Perilla frutescens var. hirtella TaxID=608512 RepID=A0AAD4P750_PERFH|nr:Calcium-dependent phospholipid-binding Copine family protein [Perilla frutescens var. hirtella]
MSPAHTRYSGQLTGYAEESVVSETTVELILKCSDMESKDLFSKSDPFLVISKPTENGMLDPIWKTDVLRNDHDPRWKPIFLSIQRVGNKDTPLFIECFNFNSNGKHDLLGKVQISLAELEKLHAAETGENLFILVSAGQNHENKIQLLVDKYLENNQHIFLNLNPMVAIDITGNPF